MSAIAIRQRRIALPTSLLASVKSVISALTAKSSTPLVPWVPKSIKILVFLLVLINSPSFPFQWHIRVWYHAIKAYWLVYRKGRGKYLDDWEATNLAAGQVRGLRTRMKRIAWLDDCDYNLHLSNSCYAKNSDPARMDFCIQSMSPLFTPGVAMALAGSHYIFIKEIPIGSPYVMETRIAGWGDKWLYVVTEFIIYPKAKSTARSTTAKEQAQKKAIEPVVAAAGPSVVPSISAPGTGESTPVQTSRTASPAPIASMEEAKKAALRNRPPRNDGGVVTCLAVFEYCFKLGRVTIPPRIALHFAFQSPNEAARAHARDMLFSKDQGKAWLRGGWKNDANADEIGRDIGTATDEDAQAGEAWTEKARKGMEDVAIGLGSL